jgi:two-component system, OmpR family, phosphate regulon sensor histidine kinase PhoR
MDAQPFDAFIAALPEPVLLVARSGHVNAANQAAVELFGAQIRNAPIRAHLRQPEVAAMLDRVLAGESADSACFTATSANAETVWQVTARPMGPDTLVLSLHDVSHREAAEAQRRDFVANVSHELRSPLTVLAGFIETLQGPAAQDAAARAEFLAIMAREAERMTGLVADLLSLSRVEGAEKIRPRNPVALDMVLRATLAALRPQIEGAGIEVTLSLPEDLPEVPGDYDQLVQVYHNLVENAVKYGGTGGRIGITATALPAMTGFEGPVLRIDVTDHGEGIDPIHIPRLTERFYRVDRARSRDQGGTGLGLAIVKHIINRHRGRLCIRSTPGQGATFTTLLPAG